MVTIAHVDAIPADAEVGAEFVVAGKWVTIEAGGIAYRPCGRCGGTGKTPFHWVANGDCFDCGGAVGAGTRRTIAEENKLAVARAKAGAKREAAREAKLAVRDAKIAEVVAANPVVGTAISWYLGAYNTRNVEEEYFPSGLGRAERFVTDLYQYAGDIHAWKIEAIVEAVEATIDYAAAQMEKALHFEANPAPLGKGIEVTGQIVSLKWVPNYFDRSGRGETPKILVVTDAGWKAYATCPRKAFELFDTIEGSRITFTAELSEKESDPDPQFRIAKGPTRVAAA